MTDNLAAEVLNEYDIVPESVTVIQGGTIKTVWKVKVSGKYLCLKRLKQTLDKVQFSANAQIYIKSSGGKVPGIILDRNKKPIVQYNGQLFILYEWINGNDLDFNNPADLRNAVQGLAAFHIASKGYKPDEECRISTKLGKWTDQYNSMRNKMASWNCADSIIKLADYAIKALGNSSYMKLTEKDSASIVLCHQDYGRGNALSTDSGIYVLDLDGVTFDLPARDLRKIIGKISENKGCWQISTIEEVLNWYTEINPLNDAEKEVLYIDLLYPHWFYGLVKNLFQGGKQLKSSEIEKTERLEESKIPLLEALLKRRE